MKLSRVRQLARLAYGFRDFVRHPVCYQDAVNIVNERLAQREDRFLEATLRLIYEVPSSPYRQLLTWAGCSFGDLAASTKSLGIEATLERLLDAGVYLTLDEFKSRIPISRPGLTIETQETDFDPPGPRETQSRKHSTDQGAIVGHTSGSGGKSTRVAYNWPFIAEEAANELILYTMHGVEDAPTAIWYPVPPGAAGIHNVLMNVGWGRPPQRWFSHSHPNGVGTSREARMALRFLSWSARTQGSALPWPEFADIIHAGRVVRWMVEAQRRHGASVVRTFVSSAVRIAQTAIAEGADLSKSTIFVGGEPLTEPRRHYIESAGLRVFPRYVITETGLVAAACPNRVTADDMHLYTDRLALIQSRATADSYLFTAITAHMGRVVFNAALGDCGELSVRNCGCVLGGLGFKTHLSGVRSSDKVTIEGMTVLTAELDEIIGEIIGKAGGDPDSFQFREAQAADGLGRLIVAISPDVKGVDEQLLIRTILDRLERSGPRTALASHFWRQASSIQIVREKPRLSDGHKKLSVLREPDVPRAL